MALDSKHRDVILARMKDDVDNKRVQRIVNDTYRYYEDVATGTLRVPITTTEETLIAYEKVFMLGQTSAAGITKFDTLPRVSMFVGQPDTGKTYAAEKIAEECNIVPLFKMCRDNLNLETLLEDFKLVDGKPVFEESLAIKFMSDDEEHIIIFDEFNTLLTGVMKTLQPIFDDTSKTFEYRGKIYKKNMKCKFIVTLNDKDKGISIVPDAILSRSHIRWFEPVTPGTISKWTNIPIEWLQNLYDIYKLLGITNLYGTRQARMLFAMKDVSKIKNHLYGLCMMRNIDAKAVETLPMQTFINKL